MWLFCTKSLGHSHIGVRVVVAKAGLCHIKRISNDWTHDCDSEFHKFDGFVVIYGWCSIQKCRMRILFRALQSCPEIGLDTVMIVAYMEVLIAILLRSSWFEARRTPRRLVIDYYISMAREHGIHRS